MSHIKKLAFIPALIGATVLTNGCGGDSHSYESLDAQLSGRAMKGVLANADCIVSLVSGDELFSSVDQDTACTNDNGRYSITLNYDNTSQLQEPISVQLQPRSTGTTYKCDFPDGCDGQLFGSDVSISDTNFSLRAYVPTISTSSSNVANLSAWTTMAATRADSLATIATRNAIDQAYRETAGVLNNILGIENDTDRFDGNFYNIDLADITNPVNDDQNSSNTKLGTLLSLASASLVGLVDTSTSTNNSVAKVINNLSTSFEDGVINVNSTAANISPTDQSLGIDLTKIVTEIEETVSEITTAYTNNAASLGVDASTLTSRLNTNLGGNDTTNAITQLETTTTNLATQKQAVADADSDPTAPTTVPPDDDSDDDDDDDDTGSGSSGSGGSSGP